ncbi:MAG: hypothetical protein KI792_01725 [Alphaproteobacteria bacterium]|nr:hypothetical protein [Alphaproteobacteria bacterium SS10]
MVVDLVLIGLSLICIAVIALVRKPITFKSMRERMEAEWQSLAEAGHDSLPPRDDVIRMFRREITLTLCLHSAAIGIPALIAVWLSSVAYLVIIPMTVVDLVAWCMVAITGILLLAFLATPRYFLDEENYYFDHARDRVLARITD